MKKFNEFITEDKDDNYSGVMATHFRGDDDFGTTDPELLKDEETQSGKYKIYTSQDGVIEFDDSMLRPYGKEENKFFVGDGEWKEQYKTLTNSMDLYFDKNKMFVFKEGGYGDMSEYKVFTN